MTKANAKRETKHRRHETIDPVLLMLGVGKQLWKHEPGDSFIERLRSEDLPPNFWGAGRKEVALPFNDHIQETAAHVLVAFCLLGLASHLRA